VLDQLEAAEAIYVPAIVLGEHGLVVYTRDEHFASVPGIACL
jgi:hypothetical protein